MFSIDKQFDFCYGHRVHNQELDKELSVDGLSKCRWLHGHNGRLKIGLQSKDLERGMVTDFKNLECIKVLVDDVLDHKFIVDINDPLFDELFNYSSDYIIWDEYNLGRIHPDHIEYVVSKQETESMKRSIRDKLEGVVVVKFVPTSENLCYMFAGVAQQRLQRLFQGRVKVAYVDFWETPKSHCRYEA